MMNEVLQPCRASRARSRDRFDHFQQTLGSTTAKEAGFLQEQFALLFLAAVWLAYTLVHVIFFFGFHQLKSFYVIPSALTQSKVLHTRQDSPLSPLALITK